MMQLELQKHIASLSSEEFEGFLSVYRSNPFIIEFVEHKAVCESILSSSNALLESNDSEQ